MEEEKDVLGLGLSSGFKFQPDDDELVEYFLLPRILGHQLPLEGMIFEDDPLSAPPWELLKTHKRENEAFFFANGQTIHGKGGRQKRTCVGGGCWEGQKVCADGDRLRVHDSGMEITWRKYMLNFHADGERGSLGWVMHEYSITAPADLASSSLRLYRIRFTGHGKSRKRKPDDSSGDDGGARAATRQARAQPDLLEENISAAHCAFPPVGMDLRLVDGGSARPAATPFSNQDYHYQGVNNTYDRPQLDSFEDVFVPDSSFLPGADYQGVNSTYAGPAAAASHQDFLGGNAMDLGAHGATSSSDEEAPGVMNEYDGAGPAAGMLPFDQGSSFGPIDESFFDQLLEDFNLDEFVFPGPCDLEAPLHDQYSSAGMQTQIFDAAHAGTTHMAA